MMYKSFMFVVLAPFAQLHCSKSKSGDEETPKCKATVKSSGAHLKWKDGFSADDQKKTYKEGQAIDLDFCKGIYIKANDDPLASVTIAEKVACTGENSNIEEVCE